MFLFMYATIAVYYSLWIIVHLTICTQFSTFPFWGRLWLSGPFSVTIQPWYGTEMALIALMDGASIFVLDLLVVLDTINLLDTIKL